MALPTSTAFSALQVLCFFCCCRCLEAFARARRRWHVRRRLVRLYWESQLCRAGQEPVLLLELLCRCPKAKHTLEAAETRQKHLPSPPLTNHPQTVNTNGVGQRFDANMFRPKCCWDGYATSGKIDLSDISYQISTIRMLCLSKWLSWAATCFPDKLVASAQ